MRTILRIVLTMILVGVALPGWAGPPYDVDDPGTPEFRHFELNLGFISSQLKGSEEQEFPGIDLNYGYRNNVQLTLGLSGISSRNSGTGRIAGIGDSALELKWRFQEENKKTPQVALHYIMKVPTA